MNIRSITALITLGLFVCIAAALGGQNDTGDLPARAGHVPGKFNFTGGSSVEFTQAIRDRWPDTNIVVAQEVTEFEVPSMDLARVDPGSLLSLLEHGGGGLKGTDWMCMVTPIQVGTGGLLYHVEGRHMAKSAAKVEVGVKPVEVMCVQSIRLLVENGFSPQQIIDAVEKAIIADGFAKEDYEILHDEPTRLLIIHGPDRAVEDAIETLDAIEVSRHPSRS